MSELTSEAKASAAQGAGAKLSPAYAAYITLVLAAVAMLNSADRNILAVLLVPIQKDLKVNDTAMGALSGLAFSFVYATIALPVARIADRGNRRNVIVFAVAFWSMMTAVCGLATNYLGLLLARFGVAAGESSAAPAQASMIGDLFTFRRRGTAFGVITVGTLIGLSVGAFVAGILNQLYGWRTAFMALALPGLAVAALVRFTVPEPQRGAHDGGDRPDAAAESWLSSVRYIAGVRTLRRLLVAQIFLGIAFNGYLTWLPAYLMRVHHLGTAEMSLWYGVAVGAGAALANLVSGYISDALAARAARWRIYFVAAMMVAGAPIVAVAVTAAYLPVVIAMMVLYSFTAGGVAAVMLAAPLELVRPRMRGMTQAVMGFCATLLGSGFGPLLLGAINDALHARFGDMTLRYTLLIVPVFLIVAAIGFYFAGRTADADAAAAGREA